MFSSEVAQWERAGLITLRSLDRNQPSLTEQRVAVPSRTSLFEVFPRFHHSCSAVVFQCFFWSDLRPALLALSSVRSLARITLHAQRTRPDGLSRGAPPRAFSPTVCPLVSPTVCPLVLVQRALWVPRRARSQRTARRRGRRQAPPRRRRTRRGTTPRTPRTRA
jgi:hypothetical protein